MSHLRESKAKSRVIILCTDGDNNVGQVDPATAGELAKGYGIRVYTIAIGKEGRVKMPIRQKGILGNTITTYQWFDNALNPELLQQIRQLTNGKFYRVTDEETLDNVYKEINQLEKTEIKATEKVHYDEAYEKFLKLGFASAHGADLGPRLVEGGAMKFLHPGWFWVAARDSGAFRRSSLG